MSEIKILLDFKSQLHSFVENLYSLSIDYIKDEETIKKISVYSEIINVLNDNDELDKLILKFINGSYLYWTEILDRSENFFIDNFDKIFKDLDERSIHQLKKLFREDKLKDEDKDIIWEYLKILITISAKYVHNKRGPKIDNDKKSYSREFMKDIKIKTIEKKCDFDLWKN